MGKKRTASGQRKDADPGSGANNITLGKNKKNRERPLAKPKPSLTLTPRADWYNQDIPDLLTSTSNASPSVETTNSLHEYAITLLDAENKAYSLANNSKSSSQKFASTIISAGTLEDKVSALTLLVQESPLHGLRAFENLLGLAKKRSRNQALMAAAAVKDLLNQGSVLPDRKLRSFGKQPGLAASLNGAKASWTVGKPLPGGLQPSHLILWAFEDWLKRQYFDFLKVLEGWCSDEVEYARSRAITYVWELLKDKPEQEENLLRLLVNKLGDTDRKIASRTSYLLLQLQVAHPAMKRIIIDAVENECLFRPSQSLHAKYYSIITLNQTILGKGDQQVASELLRIYFSMFVQLLQPGEKDSSVVVPPQKQQGGGGKAGKAASKKAKARERADAVEGELREKMTAQVLTGVNRAFPFADSESADFAERIDTIFRITHSSNFNTSIQALMLLQKLSSRKHHGVDRFYRTLYESLFDPRLTSSSKQIMYLNLLYKSLKSDINAKRVQAFVKRIFQIMSLHDAPFVCGLLYLVAELVPTFPGIRNMIEESELEAQTEIEHFVDVQDSNSIAASQTTTPQVARPTTYDPRKRDPEHSNAHKSAMWDMLPLLPHYHPSVSLFATSILQGGPTPPKPDPTSHTLMHFLDRFIYRNARSKDAPASRGSSIMQPLSNTAAADLLIKTRDGGRSTAALNNENFWAKNVKDVPVDQVFFHSYFNQVRKNKTVPEGKANKQQKKDKRRGVDDDDDDDDVDIADASDVDDGEDEIWDAMLNSRPDLEGLDGDDDDLSMGDLESAFDSDSDAGGDEGVMIADFPDQDDDSEPGADGSALFDAERPDDEELDNEEDDDDAFAFDDDEDALLDDDDEVERYDLGDGTNEEGPVGDEAPTRAEEGGAGTGGARKKKRKLKHLPTFASVADYAKLLADEPDEDYS